MYYISVHCYITVLSYLTIVTKQTHFKLSTLCLWNLAKRLLRCESIVRSDLSNKLFYKLANGIITLELHENHSSVYMKPLPLTRHKSVYMCIMCC